MLKRLVARLANQAFPFEFFYVFGDGTTIKVGFCQIYEFTTTTRG